MVIYDAGGWVGNAIIYLSLCLSTSCFSAVFVRSCPIFQRPDRNSDILCRRESGNHVKIKESKDRFLHVTDGQCEGFALSRCVGEERRLTSVDPSVVFLLAANISGVWAKIPDAAVAPRGVDWGFGVGITILKSLFRGRVVPSYQHLSMTREVNGSGALSDPGINVTHIGHYAALEIGGSWTLDPSNEMLFSLDAGLQYLHPLKVTQIVNSSESGVANSGALVLWLVGIGVAMPVGRSEMELGAHLFYNLATSGRHHLYGLRVGASFLL